jgi:hypothetical protein
VCVVGGQCSIIRRHFHRLHHALNVKREFESRIVLFVWIVAKEIILVETVDRGWSGVVLDTCTTIKYAKMLIK